MRPPTINDRRLLRLIDSQKKSQTQAAKALGVSRQAVNQRLKELRRTTTKVIVVKEAQTAIKNGFDALKQLNEINQKNLELLDRAETTPEFALKCIGELRNQIRLAMDIQINLFSVQEAERFMLIVQDVLRETAQDAYQEFKNRIDDERSLKQALRFS